MKNSFLLLLLISVFFTACQDDPVLLADLYYDRGEFDSPQFATGTYEAAAKFRANTTSSLLGKSLGEVEFYLVETPDNCTIKIYGGGTSTTPGVLLHSQDVTSQVGSNRWQRIELTSPVAIDGQDLWIAIELVHNSPKQSIGCDAGPAEADGDWLYDSADTAWDTYRSRTGSQVSINWNIRGHLVD